MINYWQSFQDTAGNPISVVAPAQLTQVGQPGNTVVGEFPDPTDPAGVRLRSGDAGVYLGDSPMEGWQGLTLIEEIDNQAQFLLDQLVSSDGTALRGLTIQEAIEYSFASPLRYFPSEIEVTETPTTQYALLGRRYFPQPTGYAIGSSTSTLSGLTGLIGGYSEAFAMTDSANSQVGGSLPFQATFDGDPFPSDDGGDPNQEPARLDGRALRGNSRPEECFPRVERFAAVVLKRYARHWRVARGSG